MNEPKHPKLTLSKAALADISEEKTIELGCFDVLLPCRHFRVDHKVAELGRASLTAEFLLRLLRAIDGLSEESAADFFGFDHREMTFVLREVEAVGYISRVDGCLWLTEAGRTLFREGSDEPQIYEIEKFSERVAFDLLALAPIRRESLSKFEFELPELSASDPELLSAATALIPKAFQQFFREIKIGRENDTIMRRSLYSIDKVTAEDRFPGVIQVSAISKTSRPGFPEPDLHETFIEDDLYHRQKIVDAAANLLDGIRVVKKPTDAEAYRSVEAMAPDFFKGRSFDEGLKAERFLRETLSLAGKLQIDRPTVPIVGTLFTKANRDRLVTALEYALEGNKIHPSMCLWKIPQAPLWGATRKLPNTLEVIEKLIKLAQINESEEKNFISVALFSGEPAPYIREVFDTVVFETTAIKPPPSLELLLIPGLVMAALVHAPIGAHESMPVPVGIISFDKAVVSNAADYFLEHLSNKFYNTDKLSKSKFDDLIKEHFLGD